MIRRLTMENWLCYRGVHEIVLGAKVYAIAAHDAANPERSNWLGKTTLLEAIRFALYGTHRHRTEDAWITRAASEGSVELELDSGLVIRRSRKRGKRTEVTFQSAVQGEADLAVSRVMGMSEDDFLATSYFEQRQMARFVLERPAVRMETVRAWTQLDKLESAHVQTMKVVRTLQAGINEKLAQRSVYALKLGVEAFDVEANTAEQLRVRGELDGMHDALIAAREAMVKYHRRNDLVMVVQQGKELAGSLKSNPGYAEQISTLEQMKGAAFANFAELNVEYERLRDARPFSGKCPVLRDECPVAKDVTARCASDVGLKNKVTDERQSALNAKSDISNRLSSLSILQQNREQAERKLEGLRAKREELLSQGILLDMPQPESTMKLDSHRRALLEEERVLIQARIVHDQQVRSADEATKLMATIDKYIDETRARIEVLQATAQIFGRNGAQKVAARGILGEIQDGANASLAECGVDLSVELTWGEEGDGLAKECEKCGAAFPTSARVKVCERCGAERGANVMERLDVKLSERSGAAEDLAGIAIQLAASGWLRRTRGATWDTAMIDEPFAQCDKANRKAMTKHFSTMLSGRYGFRQAIIVAHNADVTYALPGRIEIEWKDGKPSLRVVD